MFVPKNQRFIVTEPLERRTEVFGNELCFLWLSKKQRWIAISSEKRLILDGNEMGWYAVVPIRLDELKEILVQRLQILRIKTAAAKVVIGFHPGGRAPRKRHYARTRIQSQRLLQNRNNVGLIMINRKVR